MEPIQLMPDATGAFDDDAKQAGNWTLQAIADDARRRAAGEPSQLRTVLSQAIGRANEAQRIGVIDSLCATISLHARVDAKNT